MLPSASDSELWIVVEDDSDSRHLFTRLIKKLNGERTQVVCLASVLDCKNYAQMATKKADVLVLDLMLPDGKGKNAFETLGTWVSDAVIILSSALDERFSDELMPDLDCDAQMMLLPKPVSKEDFQSTLESIRRIYA